LPEKLESLAFTCKYSYITNSLDYCGQHNAFKEFKKFIENPSEEKIEEIEKFLSTFESLYPYLKLIANANSLALFDRKVIEAYWLGNKLLDNIPVEKVKEMILKDLSAPGLLPKFIAEKKATPLQGKIFPHHSFHVLHLNFVTKKVDPVLENLKKCIISWGTIKEIQEDHLLVNGAVLSHPEKFELRSDAMLVQNLFIKDPQIGDVVSVHWNSAVEKISENQLNMLKKYTMKNIDFVNSL